MKLSRWLVMCLWTSTVSVVVGAGWCWITWPRRTAREFVELLHAGNTAEAREIISIRDADWDSMGNGLGIRRGEFYPGWLVYLPQRPLQLSALARKFRDLLVGEQEFLIGRQHTMRVRRDRIVAANRLKPVVSAAVMRPPPTKSESPR